MLSYLKTFKVKGGFSVVPFLQLDSQVQVFAWIILSVRLFPGLLAPVLIDFPVREIIDI